MMKKRKKRNPITLPSRLEAAAAVNPGQLLIKRVAIGLACVIGVVALYYCLIPALTQNGTPDSMYVFFDNGLSQYEGKKNDDGTVTVLTAEVFATADAASTELPMQRLSDVIADNGALWSAVKTQLGSSVTDDGTNVTITNVTPENVYVSTVPVVVGQYVRFTGWDSGTVYDAMTNYRINSASREWGYDYRDFQWTSLLTEVNAADGACYYAPPQLMYNRYSAEAALSSGGEKTMVQMIYAHGDKKDGAYSKPEVAGAWVQPENADGRTFYDAVFTMEGKFGSVTGINDLSVTSQSPYGGTTLEGSVALGGDGNNGLSTANKQYLASATFFDYYSDWELAGNPLIDHEFSYGYTDAEAADKLLYSFGAKKEETVLSYNATEEENLVVGDPVAGTAVTYNFDDGTIPTGFAYVAGTAEYQGLESGSNKVYGGSGKAMKIHNTERAVLAYTLAAGENDVKRTYNITFDALRSSSGTTSVYAELRIVNADDSTTNTTLTIDSPTVQGTDTGVWSKISIPNFERPYDAKSVQLVLWSGAGVSVDNFTVTPYDATITIGEPIIGEKTAGTTIFANNYHGFVDQNGDAVAIDTETTKFSFRSDDGSYTLGVESGNSIKYAITDVSDTQMYEASIWTYNRGDKGRPATVTLEYQLNGVATSLPLTGDINVSSTTWTEISTTFMIPAGATDVYLVYSNRNARFQYDDFTLTASTITGSAGKDDDPGDHLLARAMGFSSYQPNMYIYSAEGYEPDEGSYSNKELYYAELNVYVEQECDLVFTATHYDAYDYANNTVSGNVVKTEEICTIHVPAKTWTAITTEKYDLPITAVSTNLSVAVKDNPDAKIYTDSFHLYRGYFNKHFVLGDVIASVDFSDGLGGFADNLPDTNIADSVSKLNKIEAVDGVLYVEKADSNNTGGTDYYSALDNEDEGMAMITLDVAPETYYLASGSVKNAAEDPRAYSAKFYVEYLREDGTLIEAARGLSGVSVSDPASGQETWHPFRTDFKTPENTAKVRIGVYVSSGATGGVQNYYFDDFMLREITATETAAAGSFSEGTNRISYSYQGNLFNDAISKYYEEALAGEETDKIIPLYFGSNSWMPGNRRYFDFDRHGQALFTEDQIQIALGEASGTPVYTITQNADSGALILDDSSENPGSGAYLQPYSRQYWETLYGFDSTNDNYPHGFSNSRAVDGLVVYDPETEVLKTKVDGTDNMDDYIVTPYFNTDFLRGDNDAHAAYGAVYEDVQFAFAFNEDTGYYEYDSTRAWYATRLTQKDGTTDEYYMDYYNYDQIVEHAETMPESGDQVTYKDSDLMGVKKADTNYKDGNGSSQTVYQFYPFNSPDTNDRFATENLMFGMKLDIPFNMYVNEDKRNNSMFKFSGDDDVWVYVDGKPVLDIGGTHTAVGGFIDLKNGYGVVASSFESFTGISQVDANNNVTMQSGKTGENQGITKLEKAAFALLASLEEISIDPKTVANLTNGASTAFVDAEGKSGWSWLDSVAFFDDTFTPMSGKQIGFQYQIRKLSDSDQLVIDVKVQNVDGVSATAGVAECVTFALTQFTLDETNQNVDLTEHTLSIYYLERGLNSSNFKLAFNFIPNAQREVEKVWADGTHDDATVNAEDYVDVELWRTEPINAETSFEFPEEYALVRAVAHQSQTDSGSVTSKFVQDNDTVTVQYNMNDNNVDSAATLTLNGMPLTLEAYRQLHESALALTIYLNDVPISLNDVATDAADDDDGDENMLDPGEFYNPNATEADDAGFAIKLDAYGDSGEYNYTAIKLPTTGQTTVKVAFKAKTRGVEPDELYNTWGFRTSNVWLVEAYGYDRTNNTALTVSDQTVLSDLLQDTLSVLSGGASVTLTASDMVIAIVDAVRKDETNNYYANTYFAFAAASDMSLDVQYLYEAKERTIDILRGTWNGAFTGAVYPEAKTTETVAANTAYKIEVKGAAETEQVVYFVKCSHSEITAAVGNGFSALSTMEAVIYSEPVQIGDTERLTMSTEEGVDGWKKLWDNIVDSVTIEGTTYNYRYFIREVDAYSHGYSAGLSNYKTLYYDIDNKPITPTIITVTIKGDNPATPDVVETSYTDNLELYSIDTMDETGTKGYVKIVNNPVISAEITKSWSVKEDGDKIPVVVTIYGANAKYPEDITVVDQVLLSSANNFTATIESLPLYDVNTNTAMTYYAAEEISDKYKVTYSTGENAVTKKLNGSEITVYPLSVTEVDGKKTLSLSIINQIEGFVLEIDKVDEDGTTRLEGAQFVLYEWDETLQDWVVVTNTAGGSEDEEETEDASEDTSGQLTAANVSGTLAGLTSNGVVGQTLAQATTITGDVSYNVTTQGAASDYFSFATTGTAGEALYTGSAYTTGLKIGSGQDITFTVEGTATLRTLIRMRTSGTTGNLVLTPLTGDGTTQSETVAIVSDSTTEGDYLLEYELTSGEYSLKRGSGSEMLLYYIDIEFPDETTTETTEETTESTTTTKYNKYDAESFMDALNEDDSWFSSAEGIQLANDLVDLQITESDCEWGLKLATDYGYGGWQKDPDYYTDPGSHWYHATIDNNVTTAHIRYLARAYRVTGNEQYKKSVIKGIECLLNAQYDNGGWPSVFENVKATDECGHDTYHNRITYNDSAMTKVMELLLEVRNQSGDFAGIVDETDSNNLVTRSETAVMKGIGCILNTQIKLDGELTAWCQQHDEVTLLPANARAHELEAISAGESTGIISFLRSIKSDSTLYVNTDYYTKNGIAASINAAVKWIASVVERGYTYNKKTADGVSPLTPTGNDTDYLWSRYYAVDTIPPASDYVEGATNPYYYEDSNGALQKIQAYDINGNPVTIQPNQSFFVERTDTSKETLAHSYYSYMDGNYAVTVFTDMAALPEDQQKSYSWYGTWGKSYVKKTITSDHLHVFDSNGTSSSYFYFEETGTATSALTYDGVEYATALKIGSSQQIIFTVEGEATLRTLVRMRNDSTSGNLVQTLLNSDDEAVSKSVVSTPSSGGCDYLEYTLKSGTYTLTKTGSEMLLYYIEVDYDETTEEETTESTNIPEGAMVYTTDANGKIFIGGLQAGKYRLEEVKAPIGYEPYMEYIDFEVTSVDGEIQTNTVGYEPTEYVNLAWSETDELTLIATVKNKYAVIYIPSTGGMGVYPLLAGGAVLVITAGVLVSRKRKQAN